MLKWIKFSVKKIEHEKNIGKWQKILEKSGIFSVQKSGNPDNFRTNINEPLPWVKQSTLYSTQNGQNDLKEIVRNSRWSL